MLFLLAMLALGLTSCSRIIKPEGEAEEREKASQAEGIFALPIEKRPLPDLEKAASLDNTLEYAFNANGEIEQAYREWRAAIERVPQAGALPDPRIEFSALFDPLNYKSFSTLLQSISLGASQEFPRKAKREARADQALTQAQAAGEKFRAAKYKLQRDVITAYAQLALNRSMQDLTSQTLRLFEDTYDVALHRYHAMADTPLPNLQKIDIERRQVETERRALEIARQGLLGQLNGTLNRPPEKPVGEASLPAIEFPSLSESDLFAKAVANNPDLAALRKEIEARGAAQVLAELEKKPDFMINGEVEYPLATPGATPMLNLGGAITLPLNRARIQAGIAEALAMRQAAEAQYRAAQSNTTARLVQSLAAIGDTARVLKDYRENIIPTANDLVQTQLRTYGSGGGDFLEILDTERLLINFKKLVLQAEADRLRFYAELEEIIGEDLFQFRSSSAKKEAPK